jgi:putative transcriptional regulator
MRNEAASTHEYLHPPLWQGKIVFGKVALGMSLRTVDVVNPQQVSIRNRLRALREERGLSQQAFATALNIHRSTVDHLERGSYIPGLELALRISAFFALPIEEIFIPR